MSPRISRTNRATWSARQCAPVVWIVALVGCLLVPLAHGSPSADTAATTSPAAAGAEFPLLPAESEIAFRLGTAAGPFCWSTVIADFDTDARPAFVIADRVGRPGQGHGDSIQFLLSTAVSQTVTFEWYHDARFITVRDIDHDGDLDLVVSPPLTQQVVLIWVNDGSGRFHRASPQEFPSVLPPLHALRSEHGTPLSNAALASNRAGDIRLVARAFASAPIAGERVTISSVRTFCFLLQSSLAVRGPPVLLS